MATLLSLSDEMIETILSYNDISFADIINFRCVCKKFRWAVKTGEYCFLKKKFFQRWSSAKEYFDQQSKENEQKRSKEDKQKDEKPSFIEIGISCAKQLRNDMWNYVHKEKHIECNSKVLRESLEERFSKLMFRKNDYIKILFFMDEIKHLLDQPVRAGDLTEGYYYLTLLDNLKIYWRKIILERYIEENHEELLEKSATNWAQQLQLGKYISYSGVNASLKSIALGALNFLREKHPEHSIFSTPNKDFSHWENNKIDDNCWGEAEGTQIMDILEEYMFAKLKFQSTLSKELEYVCIDYVLQNKHGNDIILYIIYESVARRLGLRCDIVKSFPGNYFELFWMPRYSFPTDYKEDICLLTKERKKKMRCFSIEDQSLYRTRSVNGIFASWSNDHVAVYRKTPAEMLKSIIDVKFPWHFTSLRPTTLIKHLRYAMPETRPNKIKFAVGMIVTHGDKYTDCSTGVIIGWYRNDFCSEFINSMDDISFTSLQFKMCSYFSAVQTYYIILTKCNKLCCVKEDDVTLTKPKWIENRNIYHFFKKFKGTHYVPNEELAEVYPYDTAIAAGRIFKG